MYFFVFLNLIIIYTCLIYIQTRKRAIVENLDYNIPVTQLKGPRGNGDMQAAKRGKFFFSINR